MINNEKAPESKTNAVPPSPSDNGMPPDTRLSVKKISVILVSVIIILIIIASPIILNIVKSSKQEDKPDTPVQALTPTPLPEPEVLDKEINLSETDQPTEDVVTPDESVEPIEFDPIDKAPESVTNLLLMGLDADKVNSDTIMVVSYDNEANKISIVSIPRDTYVVMPPDRVSILQDEKSYVPSNGVMKATDVHNYAAKHFGEYTTLQFEELLDIDIDFYATVDLSAFRKIVDLIGGVQVTVPRGGMKTRDHDRFLEIDLPEGTYTMNGKQAEQYVRMREMYSDMDLSRIKNQQNFMKQIIRQVLNKDTILNNLPQYIYTVLTHLKTDITLDDAILYVKYIKVFDPENIEFYTLPGEVIKQYYVHEPEETKALVESVFYRERIIETELSNE